MHCISDEKLFIPIVKFFTPNGNLESTPNDDMTVLLFSKGKLSIFHSIQKIGNMLENIEPVFGTQPGAVEKKWYASQTITQEMIFRGKVVTAAHT